MTKEQKLEAFRLKLEGCSYDLIAMRLGMTRQNVQQGLVSTLTGTRRKKYRTRIKSIYPAISDWCYAHEITATDLALMLDMNYQSILRSLHGRRKWRILEVARLTDLTGMSSEQAFAQ